MANHNSIQDGGVPIKRAYLVEEIADILEISRSSAYRLVKQECFHIVRIGKAIRVSKKSFDDWLDSYKSEKGEL